MKLLILFFITTIFIYANQSDIAIIKSDFKKIEQRVKRQKLRVRKINIDDLQDIYIYKNSANKVVKIKAEGGEDSYHKGEYYFKNGRLFFSYVVSSARDCQVSLRSYFSNGKLILKKLSHKGCKLKPQYPPFIKDYKDLLEVFKYEEYGE